MTSINEADVIKFAALQWSELPTEDLVQLNLAIGFSDLTKTRAFKKMPQMFTENNGRGLHEVTIRALRNVLRERLGG